MKKITTLLVLITLFTTPSLAQEALFEGKYEGGGFGGSVLKYASINVSLWFQNFF